MSRSRLLLLPFAIVTAAAILSGCGRRGPLEAPPGSALPATRTATSLAEATRSPGGGSLKRETRSQDELDAEQTLAPRTDISVPKTPFILDPLL